MDNIEKIKGFANLQKNWDSYGADPPNESVINKAITLYEKLTRKPDKISPSVVGGIGFIYRGKDRIYIEIENINASILYVLKYDTDEPVVGEENDIDKLNLLIEEHLNGIYSTKLI